MTYKGYQGMVEYDEQAKVFTGEVINTRDVITFQGKSVQELEQAFRQSIDDYLAFCKSRNEDPEKPFSGNVMLRMGRPGPFSAPHFPTPRSDSGQAKRPMRRSIPDPWR